MSTRLGYLWWWKMRLMVKMNRLFSAFVTGLSLFLIYGACSADSPTNEKSFQCHVCSYTVNDQANGYACLNNTDAMLELQNRITCGNYCVIQEQWNKGDLMTGATCGAGDAHSSGTPDITFGFYEGKREIDSVFRSCSTNWGNSCYEGSKYITCRGSCKGDYCNNRTVTDKNRFDDLCEQLSCDASSARAVHYTNVMSGVGWMFTVFYLRVKCVF